MTDKFRYLSCRELAEAYLSLGASASFMAPTEEMDVSYHPNQAYEQIEIETSEVIPIIMARLEAMENALIECYKREEIFAYQIGFARSAHEEHRLLASYIRAYVDRRNIRFANDRRGRYPYVTPWDPHQ